MFVLDVQGFEYPSEGFPFWPKEISILNTETKEFVHRFVQLPFNVNSFSSKLQAHIIYTVHNIHGIEWDDNQNDNNKQETNDTTLKYWNNAAAADDFSDDEKKCVELDKVSDFLKFYINSSPLETVIVKGGQKKKWLKESISNTVINLEESQVNCPSLEKMRDIFKSYHCNKHTYNNLNCTMENVYFLYFFNKYCNL